MRAGGIKFTTALRVLWGAVSPEHHALDGVAVVSDIVASHEPRQQAEKLAHIVQSFKSGQQASAIPGSMALCNVYTAEDVLQASGQILQAIRKHRPVVHQVKATCMLP
jgi:thiamine-phosphate diphosphorylase/hydroxyethylthiazole kinase